MPIPTPAGGGWCSRPTRSSAETSPGRPTAGGSGYYASTGILGTGSVQYSLFAIASEGGDPIQPPEGPLDAYDPAWSPNGTRIAFDGELIGKGNPGYDLYVMDAGGSGVWDLTPTVGLAERDPAWSPDGTWIAFRSGEPGTRVELIRPDGSDRKGDLRVRVRRVPFRPHVDADVSMLAVAERTGIVPRSVVADTRSTATARPLNVEISLPSVVLRPVPQGNWLRRRSTPTRIGTDGMRDGL